METIDSHMRRWSSPAILLGFLLPVFAIGGVGIVVWLALLPFALAGWIFGKRAPLDKPLAPVIELVVVEPTSGGAPRDTLLLVHGFPDGPALWDGSVAALSAAGYRCLVAALPGARGEPVPIAHTAEAIAKALHVALVSKTSGAVTLVLHDWGCVYGFVLAQQQPRSVRRVIALDVGGHLDPLSYDPLSILSIVAYQTVLAMAYTMGEGLAGRFIMRAMCVCWRYRARPLSELTLDMCYHYQGAIRSELAHQLSAQAREPRLNYPARRPVLYAYAGLKPFMFHSREWLQRVRDSPGGEIVRMPCSHWLTVDKPDELNALVLGWLERTEVEAKRGL